MIELYWDGVVVVGRSGVVASPCVVVSFLLCLSAEPCRYVVGSSEFEVVGCEDPVIVCASCVNVKGFTPLCLTWAAFDGDGLTYLCSRFHQRYELTGQDERIRVSWNEPRSNLLRYHLAYA